MIYRNRHHTFLQQLTRMAQRAHTWAKMRMAGKRSDKTGIVRHIGGAY